MHIVSHSHSKPPRACKTDHRISVGLEIHPTVFAEGSDDHAYSSLTVDRERYSGGEDIEPSTPTPPATYLARSIGQPWLYLLNKNTPGPLHVASRGKQLVIACGQHAMILSFGLQSSVIGMSLDTYREILSQEQDGTNADPEKAKVLRSFRIPDKFIVPGSAEVDRKINIFAAAVSTASAWVWAVSDFNRIVRMRVVSRDKPFEADDLKPGSQEWSRLWDYFKGGPDWIVERPMAEDALQIWRPPKPREPLPPDTPIIVDMCGNAGGAFTGLGRHTANDLLFRLAIFPSTPSHIICKDNTLFAALKSGIAAYMDRFTSRSFLDDVSAVSNSPNPFAFNERSNDRYIQQYIDVFRRTKALVPSELYNSYMRQGLFDPDHIIGQPYPEGKWDQPLKGQFKWMPVFFVQAPINAYTIIRAKRPSTWKDAPQVFVTRDIGEFCYVTTIGLAQFREHLLNQVNIKAPEVASAVVKRGRPAKVGLRVFSVPHR
ncbi:hypothetical protein PLICRDRAFT_119413 [Plicaturopsis crispa FD-325 SS-3]|uniref:Unplaced genomic scaffold PLICRscaffold_24, whole genome shotgun sequence n=1 Tax=Plicaturopsis crispa FD-325 SS-3 TaxID=944288 RepID=A0A0C9SQ82_PLICR|nr:hypothetical protein PLICRDRAFT_119413 [Plicaturopsis crispa FD-325 SS-3]